MSVCVVQVEEARAEMKEPEMASVSDEAWQTHVGMSFSERPWMLLGPTDA